MGPDDEAVIFSVEPKAGETEREGLFEFADDTPAVGSYDAVVERL
ncbi:MAG: hypothetical protein SynsKO_42900 [Synoicihabitans sp.]